jgi:hypothetical protein
MTFTLDLVWALVGFLIMFGMLAGIGINEPKFGLTMKQWCYGYLGISVVFDVLVVVALISAADLVWLTNLLLGLSAGAATGLAFHVAHHISEADEHGHGEVDKKPSIMGF